MKSIEVLAHFYKKKISVLSIAHNKTAYKISKIKKISKAGFKNKSFKYFEVKSVNNTFIIAFNPSTLNWVLLKEVK